MKVNALYSAKGCFQTCHRGLSKKDFLRASPQIPDNSRYTRFSVSAREPGRRNPLKVSKCYFLHP